MTQIPNWLADDYQNLIQQYDQNKLPHGLLMVGHEGNGSRELTTSVIQYLMCTAPVAGFACSECKSCQLLASGSHPDFLKVIPEGKSLTIKVDAIRQLTHLVSETAQQAGNKVVYIQNAEKMNLNAANALLKVLEEPTPNTFLLMDVDELSRVLPTVRSRSRLVRLSTPSQAQSLAWIAEQGLDEDSALRKLSICFDQPYEAIKLTTEAEQAWFEREKSFLNHQHFTALGKYVFSQELPVLLEQVLCWVDTSLRQRQDAGKPQQSVSSAMLAELSVIPAVLLFQFRDYIVSMLKSVKNQANLNAQLMSEQIAARWINMRGII
ncbi:DNA polymerase III subunit delta' [Reinekea sp.]|jgi:DNA polymerase-3 subunit delta'|uniref:DNA polymerase III subunit delta' n=1 Tax=Reinekea sp. TaxID=1970455 RepID=UPI0039899D65